MEMKSSVWNARGKKYGQYSVIKYQTANREREVAKYWTSIIIKS